jgi:hypothetical protein
VRLYPDIAAPRAAAILSDLLILVLLVLLAWLGLKVHDTVVELASVPRAVSDGGSAIQRGFESAGDAVGDAPVVGEPLADALRDAGAGTGGRMTEAGRQGEQDVNDLADLLGALVFLLPAGVALARYLPARITAVRRLTAAARAIGPVLTPDRERTLAMRAAYGLPYERLVRYTRDPLADLEEGRYDRLVAAALDDAGLRPARVPS